MTNQKTKEDIMFDILVEQIAPNIVDQIKAMLTDITKEQDHSLWTSYLTHPNAIINYFHDVYSDLLADTNQEDEVFSGPIDEFCRQLTPSEFLRLSWLVGQSAYKVVVEDVSKLIKF